MFFFSVFWILRERIFENFIEKMFWSDIYSFPECAGVALGSANRASD